MHIIEWAHYLERDGYTVAVWLSRDEPYACPQDVTVRSKLFI